MLNPKVSNIAVPAKGQPPAAITLTLTDTFAIVQEDPNVGNPQGLLGYLVDPQAPQAATFAELLAAGALSPPQFWPPFGFGPAYQPIEIGDKRKVHAGLAPYIGSQGTIVLFLTSATATPTGVVLYEWN